MSKAFEAGIEEQWTGLAKAFSGIEIMTLPEKMRILVDQIKELVQSITNPSLKVRIEKTELAELVQKLLYSMTKIAKHSKNLLDLLSDFIQIAKDTKRITNVKRSLKRDSNIHKLKALMEDMDDTLSPARDLCKQIQKESENNQDECLELAKITSIKASEAESTRTRTQVGGGVGSGIALAGSAAGVVTAVGVVGSVVAGFFTFGIGTVVGLAATAGGAAAVLGTAGVAGAALTASSANALYKDIEALNKLSKESKSMSKNASSFANEVIELDSKIQKAVRALERLKQRGSMPNVKEEVVEVICNSLDRYCNAASGLDETVRSCKTKFKALDEQLNEMDIDI